MVPLTLSHVFLLPFLSPFLTPQRQCPEGYTCIQGFGHNPNYDYTNFDTFGWSLLSAFRLMTQDAWEALYQMVLRVTSPYHIVFFVAAIFLGSIYLVNLILAIVAMSYDELQKKNEEEEEERAREEAAYQESQRQYEEDVFAARQERADREAAAVAHESDLKKAATAAAAAAAANASPCASLHSDEAIRMNGMLKKVCPSPRVGNTKSALQSNLLTIRTTYLYFFTPLHLHKQYFYCNSTFADAIYRYPCYCYCCCCFARKMQLNHLSSSLFILNYTLKVTICTLHLQSNLLTLPYHLPHLFHEGSSFSFSLSHVLLTHGRVNYYSISLMPLP